MLTNKRQKKETMEIIRMPYGGAKKIANRFKVSRRTVYEALKGATDSSLARMIRKAALENGGKAYVELEKNR